ncbi:hypothetical protein Tco_0651618 [Tanacetum coccineum]|uniref:Uncharacterized protein n=1 Tax=Tanacetum coccineum TaxID=301880 RepID=A0ABQ4WVA0_9ASTR
MLNKKLQADYWNEITAGTKVNAAGLQTARMSYYCYSEFFFLYFSCGSDSAEMPCKKSWFGPASLHTHCHGIESQPLEDLIETEETQPLYPRVAPLSPDYTLASPDYTLDTPYLDEDLEPLEVSETRKASPSGSTSPLSHDPPLTLTSPTSTSS